MRLIACGTCGRAKQVGKRCRCGAGAPRGWTPGWKATRLRVLERDLYVCRLGLPGCTLSATTVDHVIPRSKGGSDEDWNLCAACEPCQRFKADRLLPELSDLVGEISASSEVPSLRPREGRLAKGGRGQ